MKRKPGLAAFTPSDSETDRTENGMGSKVEDLIR